MTQSNTNLMTPFDPTKFDPSQATPQLPIGRHPVVIVDGKVVANKSNDGGMLVLTLKITDGPQKGSEGLLRLNLYHSNEKAAEIAHKTLSAICHATGLLQTITNTQQLYGKPFVIDVDFQQAEEARAKGYTEVRRIYDMQGNEPTRNSAQASAQQGASPWSGAGTAQAQPDTTAAPAMPQPTWGAPKTGQPAGTGATPWGTGATQAAQPQAAQPQATAQDNRPAWARG